MAATLAGLILDVEDMLYGLAQVERPREDTLLSAVGSAVDVTWRFAYPSMWKKDDYAEYAPSAGTVGEVVIMAEDHPTAAADVTVRRGQLRTSAAASYVAGDVFRKNPAYPRQKIERFIYEVIDSQMWPHVWYRTGRTITTYNSNDSYYPLAAADFAVEEVYQIDLTPETLGACSYAVATNRWTYADHGLAVGDHIRFTVAGSAAPAEFAADTDYWVLTVPTDDTFTLAATPAGAAIVGTANSTTDWTAERRMRSYHPLPRGWWETVVGAAGSPTDAALRIRSLYDQDQTIFYTAKTKALSSAVTSIPDRMADMIPWGVCWMLLGGTRSAARRHDPRIRREGENESQVYADASFFKQTFERMRTDLKRQLLKEKAPLQHWVPSIARRG